LEYAYRVMNGAGRIINGKFEADHESMVIEALLKQGFYIISINKEQGSKPIKINWFNKVRPLELLTMTRQLAVMLNAGLPLLKALFILIQQTSDHRLKDVLSGIKGHIEKGASLHSALAEYPEVFSPVYIHMVEAGEAGGMLADVLGQLARHLEKVREIRHRLITASVYPAIILFISIIAVVLILKLILPSFVDLFTSSGIELPLATRILLLTGAFLEKNILYIIIGLSALSLLVKRLAKSQFFRYYLDLLAIRNPVTGKIKSLIVGAHNWGTYPSWHRRVIIIQHHHSGLAYEP
jgi:type II secretory pathway component PulF